MVHLEKTLERKAFGIAIDGMPKYARRADREKHLMQLVDLTEAFMGDHFTQEAYDGARVMIQDPDSK